MNPYAPLSHRAGLIRLYKYGISLLYVALTLFVFSGAATAQDGEHIAETAPSSAAHTPVKYIAVVETDVDEHSGAAAELSPAEVRQVTAELRREAVKALPRGKYNVMTTETVMAQGSATLIECHEENCVIALGSKIGADYIVRGTISKIQALFTLSVEIYETLDGNLVASSEAVRAENIRELVEKAAEASLRMYKDFAGVQDPPPAPPPAPPTPEPKPTPPKPPEPLTPLQVFVADISVGAGGLLNGEYDGGAEWPTGERVKMPCSGRGLYFFADALYAELSIGYSAGNGKWETQNAVNSQNAPDMARSYLNIGLFLKYPVEYLERVQIFPLAGIDYDAAISGKIKYSKDDGEYPFDGVNDLPDVSALSSLWFKFGGGIDFALGQKMYLRVELLYGMRAANNFENYCAENAPPGVTATGGHGIDFKVGVGSKL